MSGEIERPRSTLVVIIAVALLAYIGIALPFPILAPLFLSETQSTFNLPTGLSPEVLLGIVLAAYPLGLFLGGQWLGTLSDQKGRRPVLVASLIGTAVGYVGSAFAIVHGNYEGLVVSRFLTGACEGNVAVARAVAADLHPQIDKTRSMAYLNATATAGYLIGPVLSGALSLLGYEVVFFAAAGLAMGALLLVLILFRETHHSEEEAAPTLEQARRTWRLFRDPALRPLLLFWLLITIGYNAHYHFYPFLLVKKWDMNSRGIASFTAMLTFFMMLSNLFLINFTAKRFGRVPTITFGALFFAASLFTLPQLPTPLSLYVLFVFTGLAIPLSGTHLTVHLSDRARADQQGRTMGLMVSLFQLSSVVTILGGSKLATVSLQGSFWLGMTVTLIGLGIFLRAERRRQREELEAAGPVAPVGAEETA